MFFLLLVLLLVSGCGNELDVGAAKALSGTDEWSGNVSFQTKFSKNDHLCFDHLRKNRADSLLDFALRNQNTAWMSSKFTDSAWAKRKSALIMGRCKFDYDFFNYLCLDGVSGLIYNVSYICSVPHKALRSLRFADGLSGWIAGIVSLLLGTLLSIVGIILATLLNTVCHPIETCANILGVAYFNEGWWEYFSHTNIIASLWDLVWGGIVYPLWQVFVFWM